MTSWPDFLGLPLWIWVFVLPTIVSVWARLYREKAQALFQPLWYIFDRIYTISGVVASIFMVLILVIIIFQMMARWAGVTFEGSTEFAGYAMAATSFFALAYAFGHGAHIRVSILLNLNHFTRLWLNAFAMFIAAITATYFARYAIKTNFLSEMLNDRTQGQDQIPDWFISMLEMLGTAPWNWGEIWADTSDSWVYTPVWVPQLPMSVGTTLLAIALWDHLIRLLVKGESDIKSETVQ